MTSTRSAEVAVSSCEVCVEAGVQAGAEQSRNEDLDAVPAAHRAFVAAIALVGIGGAVATIAGCRSMSAMTDMPMPGGGSISSMWLPASTCGQTWLGAAAAFIGMWTVMMIPMMLPSLAPVLWTHWMRARSACYGRASSFTVCMGASYFLVWSLIGTIAFVVGATLAASVLRSSGVAHAMPMFPGMALLLAGAVQFTAWKARRLSCCRTPRAHGGTFNAHIAFRTGVRLAVDSGFCCANLMAALFAIGVMNPLAMAAMTAAMLIEQRAPAGGRAAKTVGAVVVMGGAVSIALAAGRLTS